MEPRSAPRRRPEGVLPPRLRKDVPRKPDLPADPPRLPGPVHRELRSTVSPGLLKDVAAAYGAAGDALEAGDPQRAVELLTWARHAAGRSTAIREALGVALYLVGDWAGAQRELITYRRLSGRTDQNHLLADAARALGQHDKVAPLIEEMEHSGAHPERLAEGLIVLAGSRADRGDLTGARSVLERADLRPRDFKPWHLRLWYVAGDLAERSGDLDAARDWFSAIVAVDDDYLDAEERLDALG